MDTIENVRLAFQKLGGLNAHAVHIAGSKGKGTTATLLAKIIEMNGEKTGLFTSPWILAKEEMIQVNGQTISPESLEKYSRKALQVDNTLSEFEVLTLAAFQHFNAELCDFVVLECGLGGALDATNVVEHKALTILTHVELEHCDILGETIEKIARTKLGICRKWVPLLTVATEAPAVFEEIERMGLIPILAPSQELGHHHPESVGLAVTAAGLLGYPFDSVIEETLRFFVLPGRFEFLSFGPHILLLEGAHTFDSLSYFLERLQEGLRENLWGTHEPFFAVHFLKDKAPELLTLFPRNRTVWVPLNDIRAGEKPAHLDSMPVEDILVRLQYEKNPQFWVFAGSFKLVSEVKKYCKKLCVL